MLLTYIRLNSALFNIHASMHSVVFCLDTKVYLLASCLRLEGSIVSAKVSRDLVKNHRRCLARELSSWIVNCQGPGRDVRVARGGSSYVYVSWSYSKGASQKYAKELTDDTLKSRDSFKTCSKDSDK